MPEQDQWDLFASRLAPTGRLARLRRHRLWEPAWQVRFRAWVIAGAGSVGSLREQARSHRPPGLASETPSVGACLAGEGSARSALASIPLPQRGLSTDSLRHGWDGLRRCAACPRCARVAAVALLPCIDPSPPARPLDPIVALRVGWTAPRFAAACPRCARVAAVASLPCIDPSPPAWPLDPIVALRVGWTAPLRGLPSLRSGSGGRFAPLHRSLSTSAPIGEHGGYSSPWGSGLSGQAFRHGWDGLRRAGRGLPSLTLG